MLVSHAPSAREPARTLTLEQWAELPEDETGEIVDGVLVEEEVPNPIHEVVIAWLVALLHGWGRARGAFVFGSGIKLQVAARRGRIPDLAVYLAGTRGPALRGLVCAPPSIAVEVVSETQSDQRRDRIEKLTEHAVAGIRWYWLVDPELRSFEVLELGADGRYVHAVAVTEGVIDGVPGCEGLRIDVSDLWAEVDALIASAQQ
jgi:Uma2 family endonuclease